METRSRCLTSPKTCDSITVDIIINAADRIFVWRLSKSEIPRFKISVIGYFCCEFKYNMLKYRYASLKTRKKEITTRCEENA